MREIKFRGRQTKPMKSIWHYGDLLNARDGKKYIQNFCIMEVDENTVGQFTGLHDKNGKEIYEGNIVEWTTLSGNKYRFSVEYSDKYAQFVTKNNKDISMNGEPLGDYENIEVIGNIYDNPELLEVE